VGVFEASRTTIDSVAVDGITSDVALSVLRPGLVGMGFEVEASKRTADVGGEVTDSQPLGGGRAATTRRS
jgi:hypothetical protein